MKPDSKILARRIDAMVAFQNGEQVQYRLKPAGPWTTKNGAGLVFNFTRYEYRIKPVMIEGWVDPLYVHSSGSACAGLGCIHVRQIEDET